MNNVNTNTNTNTNGLNAKTIALIGLMAAVTCIMGPLSIPLPFSPVPISLTNLAIYLTIYVLGMKKGTLSYIIYLLLGFAGLPVFSGFTSGPAKLLGPTGGYLIGFIFLAIICGIFIEKWPTKRLLCFIGMVIGTAVCYLFGTVWLAYQAGMSFYAALAAGVIPFIPGDLVKIVIAMILGTEIRKRLKKADLV
ncbi:MAG: biotin transporter BioY [Lachnospiraceae bacterium]